MELGLRPGDLDAIQNQHDHDIDRALNAMVSVWLRKDYNVTRFGPPSWSRLVEAVGNAAGGRNPAQAEQIAANHPGECLREYLCSTITVFSPYLYLCVVIHVQQ